MKRNERITHAALISHTGMILLGKSHADCFHQAKNTGIEILSSAGAQGFFTDHGRFVDRQKAAAIALRARQAKPSARILFSEDLWSPQGGGRFDYDSVRGYFRRKKE